MPARKKPAGQSQVERDAIALGRIESYMDCLIKDTFICPSCKKDTPVKDLSSSAVTLIRSRYDKLRPTLQAVEQTNVNPERSKDDIINDIRAILEVKPELLSTLIPGYTLTPITPALDTNTVSESPPQTH
jgi:hypothetical protein